MTSEKHPEDSSYGIAAGAHMERTRTMRFVDWYARYHVKLGIAGLALTAVLNLVGDGGRLFERGWWTTWFPSYLAWAVVLLIGVRPTRRDSAN
jgi:hypothetical protein